MNMDALQPEPLELLDLLQDIIAPFVEQFASRFNPYKKSDSRTATESVDEKMSWRDLSTNLSELSIFLKGYDEQVSPISQELDKAMRQVARSLESTIHGSRIRQVIRIEKPKAPIPTMDVSKISIKHKYL